ncbi:MAG: hypothetical protein JNN20_02030 [Betaproteobacteria bacterium]|nr:hypothetical protein [Betaproteobacteria bacterium]
MLPTVRDETVLFFVVAAVTPESWQQMQATNEKLPPAEIYFAHVAGKYEQPHTGRAFVTAGIP